MSIESEGTRYKKLFLFIYYLLFQARAADAASTCIPFSDPGCFFGENWESGTLSGWAINAPANASLASPGLNGTNHTAQLRYGGIDQGIWADTNVNHVSVDGETAYIEFWITYPPGFTWAPGPAGVPSMKTFEVDFNVASGCWGRLLLFTWGIGDYTRGSPRWLVSPNINCGGTGQDEVRPEDIGSSFTVTGGGTYHVVVEIKVASGRNGSIKTWYNNELIMSQSGIQTNANPDFGWGFIRIGGQYGNPGGTHLVSYDQLRMTTTDIAPRATGATPQAPTNLKAR